MKSDIVTV